MQWPGHAYLGPGNKLENSEPVDRDDLLAALHDYAYAHGDIHSSDLHYSADFFLEYLRDGRLESFAGALGLSSKWILEQLGGQMYPWQSSSSQRPTHAGHRQYAERQREISRLYREAKQQHPKLKWNSFLKARGDLENIPIEQLSQGQKRPAEREPEQEEAGPSVQRQRLEAVESVNMDLSAVDWEEMQIESPEGTRVVGGKQQSAGAKVSPGGGGKLVDIPRSLSVGKYTLTFHKSRIFYTYGYAFQQIVKKGNPDVGDSVYMSTPFCKLPVDALGFYMTPNEILMTFTKQNKTIRCIHAKCTVVPQGLRTAFDTGTSLSGTATSEHCAIGMSAIGLNHKVYMKHGKFSVNATKPMIPTDMQDVLGKTIWKKYYGTDYKENETNIPMCLGVPRHATLYAALLTNSARVEANYASHDEGWYQVDKYINRFLFTSKIGQPIIKWSHKPKNGYLCVKAHDIPYEIGGADILHVPNWQKNKLTKLKVSMVTDGTVQLDEQAASTFVTGNPLPANLLNLPIEPNSHINLHDAVPTVSHAIPSVHMGLFPTPSLNPAKDETDFQNTAAYFSVTCSLTLEIDQSSLYPLTGNAHCTSDNVLFCMKDRTPVVNWFPIQPLGHDCYE